MFRAPWRALLAFFCLAAGPALGAISERSCHVTGVETPAVCVTLAVPRDYDHPTAGTLQLTAVVIPATTARPAPDPLLVLAGGPGQAASSLAGAFPAFVTQVRRTRDLILFDVRGTGLSEPLDCALPATLRPTSSLAEFRVAARQCAAELGERARHHTDREVVEDLERFRTARGYAQLNLWGGSFGTRIAQHYVRAYGQHTRSVVLDAVTPVATSALVTGAHAPDAALDKLFERCKADAACAAAFPDLPAKLQQALALVEQRPVAVAGVDPLTGHRITYSLDYLALSNAVRAALYSRITSEVLPLAIDAAADGNFAPLLGIISAIADPEQVTSGAQFSMLCAEDWPVAHRAGTPARTGGFMRDGYYAFFNAACEEWLRYEVPSSMLAPLQSSVPVLAISGDSDPVTPPQLATQALQQFATGVHVIVPRGFHGNTHNPCVARIIMSFVNDPRTGGRDHKCTLSNPPLRFNTSPAS